MRAVWQTNAPSMARFSPRARGSSVDYLGREDVDGTNAYKLRVTQKDGTVFTYWLDPDAWLEIRILERRTIRGSEKETQTDLGDYEKVAGVYFPFSISQQSPDGSDAQVITIKAAEANPQISPALFAMPVAK